MALRHHEPVLPEDVNDRLDNKNVLSAVHLNIRSIINKGNGVVAFEVYVHALCNNVFGWCPAEDDASNLIGYKHLL